jgi:hypothetical protein
VNTRHFSYETAAAEFEIPERWLRTHIGVLPHRRIGKYVRFSCEDILAISDMFAAPAPAALAPTVAGSPDIRPSRSRRKTSHSK